MNTLMVYVVHKDHCVPECGRIKNTKRRKGHHVFTALVTLFIYVYKHYIYAHTLAYYTYICQR